MDLAGLGQQIRKLPQGDVMGRVSKVVGLIVESRGPEGSVGEQMLIHLANGNRITAEVVGFNGEQILLMPVENTEGIRPGLLVEATGHQPEIPVSEALLGRVIDPLGRPLDGGPPLSPMPICPFIPNRPIPCNGAAFGKCSPPGCVPSMAYSPWARGSASASFRALALANRL